MLDKPEDVLGMMGNRLFVFAGRNPVKRPCRDCPFTAAAEGRDYLAPGRLDGIKVAVLLGQQFSCHKTVYQKGVEWIETEDGREERPSYHRKYQVCAGALAWAADFLAQHGGAALINGEEPER